MTGDALSKAVRPRLALGRCTAEATLPCAVAAVLALVASAFMALGSRDFCLDDAWIHLAYAKSLRLGDGFAYNPGDHETGFSSPLWAAVLALCPILSHPILTVKVLGASCHAALAWGAVRVTRLLSADEGANLRAWVAGAIVACDPLLVFAAGSGMEVSLTAALLIWTVFVVERADRAPDAANLSLGLILGAACLWSRPECLFLLGPYCALRWYPSRNRTALAPLTGAVFALALWMVYCQVVSGYPWPNTYYAKRHADPLVGLLYFAVRVLPAQAWAVGLSGIVLVCFAFARSGRARALALAWLCAVVAIAASREVLIGALFYCSRYFAIFGAIPCVLAASQLPARRNLLLLMAAPVALASLLLLPQARVLQRAQEDDITTQHTEPARFLAHTLPAQARLAVEGAGATRFFLPRSIHVIDVVGLNYAAAVHARTTDERLCSVMRAQPTHVFLPDGFFEFFQRALVLEPIRTFVDEQTAVTVRSSVRRLHAAQVIGVQPTARRICGLVPSP